MLAAFGCVYFFWGSTYVAMRFGVQVLPPLVLASTRYLIAGPLMLAICAARGLPLWQTKRDFTFLAAIGVLMLGLGNTGVVWCEQYLSSGLAALLLASIPLFVALFEAFLPAGEGLSAKGWTGIVIGFLGLLILVSPGLHGQGGQLFATLVALGAAFAWTCGSVLARHARLATTAFVAAAWEMVFGGLFNSAMMLAAGSERHVRIGPRRPRGRSRGWWCSAH